MIFEEDVDYFGKHIYVNIGSKQVIAVYLGYYDQEQSWIAVVVKHHYDENDISFKKILIYNSLIESVVPDDVKILISSLSIDMQQVMIGFIKTIL